MDGDKIVKNKDLPPDFTDPGLLQEKFFLLTGAF
jgi:hypothetical protein